MKHSEVILSIYNAVYVYFRKTRHLWDYTTQPPIDMVSQYSDLLGEGLNQLSRVTYYVFATLPFSLLFVCLSILITNDRTNLTITGFEFEYATLISVLLFTMFLGVTLNGIFNDQKPYPKGLSVTILASILLIPVLSNEHQIGVSLGIIHAIGVLSTGRVGTKFLALQRKLVPTVHGSEDSVIDTNRQKYILLVSVLSYISLSAAYLFYTENAVFVLIVLCVALSATLRNSVDSLIEKLGSNHTGARWLVLSQSTTVVAVSLSLMGSGSSQLIVLLLSGTYVAMADFTRFTSKSMKVQRNAISGLGQGGITLSDAITDVNISTSRNEEINNPTSEFLVNTEVTIGIREEQQKDPQLRIDGVSQLIKLQKFLESIGETEKAQRIESLSYDLAERGAQKVDPESSSLNDLPDEIVQKVVRTDDSPNGMDTLVRTDTDVNTTNY